MKQKLDLPSIYERFKNASREVDASKLPLTDLYGFTEHDGELKHQSTSSTQESLIAVEKPSHDSDGSTEANAVQTLLPQSPTACSKFEACSANVCPLDRKWRLRSHLRGEPSCHYLRLAAKGTATESEQSTPAYCAAVKLWEQRDTLPPILLKQLEKSSTVGRRVAPLRVDPVKAEQAMKRLEDIFGGVTEGVF